MLPGLSWPLRVVLALLVVLVAVDEGLAQNDATRTSAGAVTSPTAAATTTLPPETIAPRPFPDLTPAPPVTLSEEERREALFVHKSFAWSDIKLFKQRVVNKWWVSVIILPTACIIMNAIANLQRGVDRSTNHNLKDFVEYLSRNIAAATIIGGTLGMMAYTRVDEEEETNLSRRDVRWSLLVAWSYHTIFVFTIFYSLLLTVLYYALARVLLRWSQWEASLSKDPDDTPKSSVFHDLNLMILVRRLFYLQLRLVFPNADFKTAYGIQVTRYLRAKEREMVAELASFSRWSDWLVMVVFVLVNGLRMSAISQGEPEVTPKMRLQDGMTFAFAVGFFPLLIFYVIYRRLVAGLWRFLRTAIAATSRRLKSKERERALRVGRIIVAGRTVTDAEKARLRRDGDGSNLFCDRAIVPALPDPGSFVPFGSAAAVSALWRAAIVVNALYLAVLVMGLSHMFAVKLDGGPAVMICCLMPTAGLVWMLPWSTAAVVVIRYLGCYLDVDAALLTFADPNQEDVRATAAADGDGEATARGPTKRFDEGDAADATREEDILERIHLDKPIAVDHTLLALQEGINREQKKNKKGRGAKAGQPESPTGKSGHTKSGASSALAAMDGLPDRVEGVPLALSTSHSDMYQRNMHHVNERLLELKSHEKELHAAVMRASHRRRQTQKQLEGFVDAVARRPDLNARWKQAVDNAHLQSYEAQRAAGADYERRLAALEARQRATVRSMDAEESSKFSFHDVFQKELLDIEASMEQEMVFTGSIPSLQQVFDAIGATEEEAAAQLPWRKVPQRTADPDAALNASSRFMEEAMDATIDKARRLRRRALRNARRSKPLDEKELARLAQLGITQMQLKQWDAELKSSSSSDDDGVASRATAALGADGSVDGRCAPASEAATELERLQDLDPAFWGLTEEDIQHRAMPPAKQAVPDLDLGLVEWREQKRQKKRAERRAQGLPSDDEDELAERAKQKQQAMDAAAAARAANNGVTPSPEKAKPRPSADPFEMSLFSDAPRSSRYDDDNAESPAPTPAAAADADVVDADKAATSPVAPVGGAAAGEAVAPKPKPKPKPKAKRPAGKPGSGGSAPNSAAPSTAGISIATSGGRSVARHLRPDAGDPLADDPDL